MPTNVSPVSLNGTSKQWNIMLSNIFIKNKEGTLGHACIQIFTAALFTIAKNWKLRCLSKGNG